jgi:phenylacetic acid degradation operon negative regulatory protein
MTTDRDLDRRLGVRRLTARSVIASTLLGVTPPELPTRSLVATAELLGVAPGTARVAMSRMVAAGELAVTDDGYRLVSASLLARQERQTRSRTGPSDDTWDGAWHQVVVTGEARPPTERVELRATLTARRYAELREGVWLRPDNLGADQRMPTTGGTEGSDGRGRLLGMQVRPDDPTDLAATLWDLGGWADRARLLLTEVDRLAAALEAGDDAALADGFVVAAAVLRHFQADPLLPADLLPTDWPGPDLRHRYDALDTAFRTTLTTWQRAHR